MNKKSRKGEQYKIMEDHHAEGGICMEEANKSLI